MSRPTDRAEPVAPIASPGPEPLSADRLRDWVARRERSRHRIKVVVAALLAVGAVGVGLVVSAFHDQFLTMGRLRALGFSVDWDLDLANLRRGGMTAVACRPDNWWAGSRQTSDVDLRSIARLRHVTSLDLSSLEQDLRDADLSFLAGLTDLTDLQLNRNPDLRYRPAKPKVPLTDGVIDHIAGLTRLKSLGLSDNRITDAGLAKIAGLVNLETLDLDGTRITDAGLARLASLVNLETLNLVGTRITDRGLPALKGLTKLRMLRVEDTKITREGVASLQKLLPELEITREQYQPE